LARSIVLAIRELMKRNEPDAYARDLASYIALALNEISASIETSVVAWEKRGYWVKADRFRLEWEWAGAIGANMKTAVLVGDWEKVAELAIKVMSHLNTIQIPEKHRLGKPWLGAWEAINQKR
jgi:hypothetical protein